MGGGSETGSWASFTTWLAVPSLLSYRLRHISRSADCDVAVTRYVKVLENNGFESKALLWMKVLEGFHVLSMTPSGGELLLASCSQDCLIRVWKLRAKCRTDARIEDDRDVIRMKEDVFEVMERGEQPAHGTLISGAH